MMKMDDMGYKNSMQRSPVEAKQENSVSYPHLSLYHKVPEFLMKKDIGDTCHVMLEVRVKSKGMNERDGHKNEEMELEVMKMGVHEGEKENSLKNKLSKRQYA